eukprot:1195308-Prorocentrum_minimum.AAC.4
MKEAGAEEALTQPAPTRQRRVSRGGNWAVGLGRGEGSGKLQLAGEYPYSVVTNTHQPYAAPCTPNLISSNMNKVELVRDAQFHRRLGTTSTYTTSLLGERIWDNQGELQNLNLTGS